MTSQNQDNQTMQAQENMKAQKDAQNVAYRQSARLEALRYAPNRKGDSNSKTGALLTASEIKDEAEIIYQWLIKDL